MFITPQGKNKNLWEGRHNLYLSFANFKFSTKMTVTDVRLKSFLKDRENIVHIVGSKFISVFDDQE